MHFVVTMALDACTMVGIQSTGEHACTLCCYPLHIYLKVVERKFPPDTHHCVTSFPVAFDTDEVIITVDVPDDLVFKLTMVGRLHHYIQHVK